MKTKLLLNALIIISGINFLYSLKINPFTEAQAQAPSLQSLISIYDTMDIGDVRYSILDPEQFIQLHGKNWLPLEGQDISSTWLGRKYGIKKLPDARAMFIRGMNRNRGDNFKDPDGNREPVSAQSNKVGQINFELEKLIYNGDGASVTGYAGDNGNSNTEIYRRTIKIDSSLQNNWISHLDISVPQPLIINKNDETRPNNIPLYIYIKVGPKFE